MTSHHQAFDSAAKQSEMRRLLFAVVVVVVDTVVVGHCTSSAATGGFRRFRRRLSPPSRSSPAPATADESDGAMLPTAAIATTTLRAGSGGCNSGDDATDAGTARRAIVAPSLSLQSPHPERTPEATFLDLARHCRLYNITSFDVYGDFDGYGDPGSGSSSFLRRFEREVVDAFRRPDDESDAAGVADADDNKIEDAVFMPSGVMAQAIALLVHHRDATNDDDAKVRRRGNFACHETCHLLLHEQDSYRELLDMDAVVISTKERRTASPLLRNKGDGIRIPPLELEDVRRSLLQSEGSDREEEDAVASLIIELPHRELGGTLTPWTDLVGISELCRDRGVAFHCDGARIFEASAGYGKSLPEIARLFDSVYVSFYKGLGGMSGAMLLGSKDFCHKARVWLRRFGGNLYTITPYAVSAYAGFRRHWCLESSDDQEEGDDVSCTPLSFKEKKDKLQSITASLSGDESINSIVTFDPAVPETNMVHGYLRFPVDACNTALDAVESRCGIRVLRRVKAVPENVLAFQEGYRSCFEWSIGENNGRIPNETFFAGWSAFASLLLDKTQDEP